MTEDPTVEPWYDAVIEYVLKKERTARLRKKLAAARDAGLAERHRRRLERARKAGER